MNCNKVKDQLIDYLLNTLNQGGRDKLETHLVSCPKCQQKLESFKKAWILFGKWEPDIPSSDLGQIRHKVIENIRVQKLIEEKSSKESLFITTEREKTETQTARPKTSPVSLLKTIINYKIMAFASAAVIIIGIVFGVNIINKLSMPDVVWGELVERIEGIDFYTFKSQSISMDIQGTFVNQQTNKYYISRDGFRIDRHFPWIYYDIIGYASWSDKIYTTVFPEIKKYTRVFLTDERINRMSFLDDPKLFIKLLMTFNYTKLSSRIIDGKKIEGIEVNDPKFGKMGLENCVARLWVDMDTKLPMLLEVEGTSGHGTVETKIVFNSFEWDGEFDESIFEPDLSGYSLMAEVESLPVNEESAIEALQKFSEVAGGKYPSNLLHTQAIIEINNIYYKMYKERMGKGFLFWEEEDFDWESYTALHEHLLTACMFYGELFDKDKEVIYHGKKITANDSDLPLMRWKISNDEYRVMFGDLRIKNESLAELAELEATLGR
jgi:hypothetical protein